MAKHKDSVVDVFTRRIDEMISIHIHLMNIAQRDQERARVEDMLVEQFLLSAAVKWETFVNDVVVDLIESGPARFRVDWKKRVQQSLGQKFGVCTNRLVRFDFPTQFSRELIESMLNPRGDNLTQTNSEQLQSKTASILDAKVAQRFSLDTKNRLLIDFFVALRNCLAHKSRRSRTSLQAMQRLAVKEVDLDWLRGSTNDVGRYLRSSTTNGRTIAVRIVESVKLIALEFQ